MVNCKRGLLFGAKSFLLGNLVGIIDYINGTACARCEHFFPFNVAVP